MNENQEESNDYMKIMRKRLNGWRYEERGDDEAEEETPKKINYSSKFIVDLLIRDVKISIKLFYEECERNEITYRKQVFDAMCAEFINNIKVCPIVLNMQENN